jgi:1-aminocyclopropane-1-carboxylate deaminase
LFSNQPIIQTLSSEQPYQVDVLRLDLIDEEISGNKWYKLKYNLAKAIEEKHTTIITFGGAHSNHIAAAAAMIQKAGLQSIGIIRGEEELENPTLKKAKENGMRLHFVNREFYKQKNESVFSDYLNQQFGRHYLIPEGGNNTLGLLGCTHILRDEFDYDYILCACGTGTTFAGLVASCKTTSTVIGINVLKGNNQLPDDVIKLLKESNKLGSISIKGNEEVLNNQINNHCITNTYCFSGYAAYDHALIRFKTEFEKQYSIPLDYVYTNKLFYAAFDFIKNKKFKPQSKILIIHSGGLQGNLGFESRYQLKLMR